MTSHTAIRHPIRIGRSIYIALPPRMAARANITPHQPVRITLTRNRRLNLERI
jgi:hypothetical protein